MSELASRRMQDMLTNIERRLTRLEQDAGTGLAIRFTPVVSMSGSAPTQGANEGFWWRHNDLLEFWIFIVIGATVGSGDFTVGIPGGVLCDDLPLASCIGGWAASIGGRFFEGWVQPAPGNDKVAFLYLPQGNGSASLGVVGSAMSYGPGPSTATMATGDALVAFVTASIADPP